MAHKVARLERKKLFNVPHLISTESFETVVDYLEHRPDGMLSKQELAVARDISREKKKNRLGERSVAVIPVEGVLTYQETMFGALCGMSSYQGIEAMMHQAIAEGYKTVVLDVDSGGGEAYGTFETAKNLRQLATQNNIKLIAYVDGISASAAYGLSVAADEIILNPYAEVGSIGVVTQLVNNSEKLKKEGLSRTFVYAGDNKIPFDAEGEFREDFIKDIQNKVDTLYDGFVTHVAGMREMSEDVVRDTQAKMFSSETAISLGLADKVMEKMEFAEYLADLEEGKDMPLNLFNRNKEEKMSKDTTNTQNPEVKAGSVEESEVIATLQAEVALLKKERETATLEREAAAEALKVQAKASFATELSDFSFVEDSAKLADALFDMSEDNRAVVMDVLEKADKALEASIAEPMAIEGEEDIELTTDAAKDKAAVRAQIEAKYAASDK